MSEPDNDETWDEFDEDEITAVDDLLEDDDEEESEEDEGEP